MSNLEIQAKPEEAAALKEDEEVVEGPLSPDEFRSVLEKIDALGIRWTPDIPSAIVFPPETERSENWQEFKEIQAKYPHFPYELSSVIFYALTGSEKTSTPLGPLEDAKQKAAIVQELIIERQPDFRREFFFKYAIKVPYFFDLDWEVVIKTFERNVKNIAGIPYALLMLNLREPVNPTLPIGLERIRHRNITVAVDEQLVDKLIRSLSDLKQKLIQCSKLTPSLTDEVILTKEGENQ